MNEQERTVVGVPDVWVRVWLGRTAVAHYRAERDTAVWWVETMRRDRHFRGLRYTIDPMPSYEPPERDLPVWQVEQVEQVAP